MHGVVMLHSSASARLEHQQLQLEALDSIPGGCPVLFSFSKLTSGFPALFIELDDAMSTLYSTGGCTCYAITVALASTYRWLPSSVITVL